MDTPVEKCVYGDPGDEADGLRDGCTPEDVTRWIDRSRDLDGEVDHAWALVRQAQESARWNPRRSARQLRDPKEWRELLRRMEQAIAEIRSMARTLGGQHAHREAWGDVFALPGSKCWGTSVARPEMPSPTRWTWSPRPTPSDSPRFRFA